MGGEQWGGRREVGWKEGGEVGRGWEEGERFQVWLAHNLAHACADVLEAHANK